jgi:hypothetical protein
VHFFEKKFSSRSESRSKSKSDVDPCGSGSEPLDIGTAERWERIWKEMGKYFKLNYHVKEHLSREKI